MYKEIQHKGFQVFLLGLAVMLLAACQAEEEPQISNSAATFDVQDQFKNSETVFTEGETVRFVCKVTNDGSATIELGYTAPACHPIVRDASSGEVVWDPYHGMGFIQVITYVEVAPGESLTFVLEWDMQPTPELASDVPPGDYIAEPTLFVSERDSDGTLRLDESDSIAFTIQ